MNKREKLCAWLFEVTKKPYALLFKRRKDAWSLCSQDLLTFNEGSLGHEVGRFLRFNKIELIDKLESHDVCHVITGMGITVKNEVGMQFFLLGNGKRSFYLFSTIAICLFLLPEYFRYFMQCIKRGNKWSPLHNLDLQSELFNQVTLIRWRLKNENTSNQAQIRHFGILNENR